MPIESQSGYLRQKRIIVYNDSRDFGGHEIMTLHVIHWLLSQGAALICFYRPENEKWRTKLRALESDSLTLHEVTLPKIRFHQPYHFFHPSLVSEMAGRFRKQSPDAVFVAQGTLETSAVGALAARKAGLPCTSYIPLAHSFKELGSSRPRRRDLFNRYLVQMPDMWLTIDKAQASRLKKQGARQLVEIVPVIAEIASHPTRREARQQLGLKEEDRVIGMCGRLENAQKGCDILVDALLSAPEQSLLRKSRLLFVGDGKDWEKTRITLEKNGWRNAITHIPWAEAPAKLYPAFDLMVMPSRYEGLPISMLEAILCDTPVAATAVDGMASFLPPQWTCEPESHRALLELMQSYLTNPDTYRTPLPNLKKQILSRHSHQAFESALAQSMKKLLF